jgi:hypothetical protein
MKENDIAITAITAAILAGIGIGATKIAEKAKEKIEEVKEASKPKHFWER